MSLRSRSRPGSVSSRGGALVLVLLVACVAPISCSLGTGAAPSRSAAPERPSGYRSPLVISLLELADSALAERDLASAQDRYQRALKLDPSCHEALLGLAEIARLRGDASTQRTHLEAAVRADPDAVGALRELALLEDAAGRSEEARRLIEEALPRRPLDPHLLDALAEVTGRAPELAADAGEDEIFTAARRHPLDPGARLRAGSTRIAMGDVSGAVDDLEAALIVPDWDPVAARRAAALLRKHDPSWAGRRFVEVHSWADESVRDDPIWQMRLRIEWKKLSHTLDSLIETVFLPVSLSSFSSAQSSPQLVDIRGAWASSVRRMPRQGILAAFTARPPPTGRQAVRLGEAELLGRRTLVRIDFAEPQSRVLIHEAFHLFGGVHVAQDLDSLMNPKGESVAIDPVNVGIARLTRVRRFGPGGLEQNVFPFVETEGLIDVYRKALSLNLSVRNADLQRAQEASERSRFLAADIASQAVEMDSDLAQVAELISELLIRERLFAMAANYCDVAAGLQGNTPAARRSRARAERLRDVSRAMQRTEAARSSGEPGHADPSDAPNPRESGGR